MSMVHHHPKKGKVMTTEDNTPFRSQWFDVGTIHTGNVERIDTVNNPGITVNFGNGQRGFLPLRNLAGASLKAIKTAGRIEAVIESTYPCILTRVGLPSTKKVSEPRVRTPKAPKKNKSEEADSKGEKGEKNDRRGGKGSKGGKNRDDRGGSKNKR